MNFLSRPGARRRSVIVLVVVAVAVVAMTALAIAKSTTVGVASAKLSGPSGARTEPIAVNGKGVAIYALSPETAHHLLCNSSICFQAWPPVKVAAGAKLTKAAGVSGKLGTLKRKGFTQLTLNGHPVYNFIEDAGKKGVAAGDGFKSFGGQWHVFKEGSATSSSSTSGPTKPAPGPTGYTAPTPTSTATTPGSGAGW
jgi:predicted lipoprotein with Yx(FWY)xxD motif